jgi:uncharacterized phage protein (TIGR02216 family)
MERFGESAARLCNAAGLVLGWRPGDFWDATPAELELALQPPSACECLDRQTVDALIRRFPDDKRS